MSGWDKADECVGLGARDGLLTPDTRATKHRQGFHGAGKMQVSGLQRARNATCS